MTNFEAGHVGSDRFCGMHAFGDPKGSQTLCCPVIVCQQELLEDLAALEKDYEEVGIETAEGPVVSQKDTFCCCCGACGFGWF